jgi:hypothetical protein
MWSPCVWLIDYECAWNIPVRKRVTSAHTLFVTNSLTARPRLSRSLRAGIYTQAGCALVARLLATARVFEIAVKAGYVSC